MAHDHGPNAATGDRRVGIAIAANLTLTIAQIIGGLFSGSLALIADAIHNFSDMGALVIAFVARKIARRPADGEMTFGYGRLEVVAAVINYTSLILIGFYLIYEGLMRSIEPPAIEGWTVVILGTIALIVDTATVLLTATLQKGSVNIRALFLHNLSDALASVAVVAGGGAILLFGWSLVDPLVTLGIAGYILWISFHEVGGPIRTLALGSPPGVDTQSVVEAMNLVSGVSSVHHVHFWQMQEHEAALDAHVVIGDHAWERAETIKRAVKQAVADEFGIEHSTLELERETSADHEVPVVGHEEPDRG